MMFSRLKPSPVLLGTVHSVRFGSVLALTCLGLLVVGCGCSWFATAARAAEQPSADQPTLEAPAITPAHVQSTYLKAKMALAEGDLERARQWLQSIVGSPASPPAVWRSLASIYARQGNHEKAREVLGKGRERYPRSVMLLREQARLELAQKQLDAAIEALERVIDFQPHRVRVLQQLSSLYLQRLQKAESTEELKQLVKSLINVYEQMLTTQEGEQRLVSLLVLSSLYLRSGRPHTALERAREAVDLEPVEVRTHMYEAEALVELDRIDAALDAFAAALTLEPDNAELRRKVEATLGGNVDAGRRQDFYVRLAEEHPEVRRFQEDAIEALMQGGRWAEAEERIAQYETKWPGEPEMDFKKLQVLLQIDRMDEAVELALELEEEHGDGLRPEVCDLLVGIFMEREQWEKAERRLQRLIEEQPGNVRNQLRLIKIWLNTGRIDTAVDKARVVFEEAGELAPVVGLTTAKMLADLGKGQRAVDLLEAFHRARPENQPLGMSLASYLLDQRRFERAVALLEQMREDAAEEFSLAVLHVEALLALDQPEAARRILDGLPESVVEENRRPYDQLRMTILQHRKQWDAALEVAGELIERHPGESLPYIQAGIICQEMKDFEQAEAYYQQAIEVDPTDPEAYNTLGYYYAETNQKLDRALELILKAAEMKPRAGHIVDSLGWVYYQKGEFETAVEKLETAVELMRHRPDPVIYEHLGDAYEQLGNVQQAREAWTRALELDESAVRLRRKLEEDGP